MADEGQALDAAPNCVGSVVCDRLQRRLPETLHKSLESRFCFFDQAAEETHLELALKMDRRLPVDEVPGEHQQSSCFDRLFFCHGRWV